MSRDIDLCRASIARHSKSFALASKLLPAAARDPAAILYAWCRRADDAIDDCNGEEQQKALSRLRRELDDVYDVTTLTDPVLRSFRLLVRRYNIPKTYPTELLLGMEMDALGYHYRTWDDLLLYCYRVASTVGLMMCHIMGVSSRVALTHAADLGVAMQLTNIARDVLEDWERGRLYLPEDLLRKHGVGDLGTKMGAAFPESAQERFRGVLRELLRKTDSYYRSGDAGLTYLSSRCAVGVSAARWVYSGIGRKIAARRYDVLAPRAVVPKTTKLGLCLKAAFLALRHQETKRSWSPVPNETAPWVESLRSRNKTNDQPLLH